MVVGLPQVHKDLVKWFLLCTLKGWYRSAEDQPPLACQGEPGRVGNSELGSKWRIFLELIQVIWDWGEIPEQMSWMVIVLLLKGGGDFRGIGLLYPFWNVVEKIMVR